MKIIPQSIEDIFLIEPNIFSDERGYFFEAFRQDKFEEVVGYKVNFCQDNESKSNIGVVRGLHYQLNRPQGKLVRVIFGSIIDVAVDIRIGSPTFGKSEMIELSHTNKKMLYIPEGFAHGFLCLSDKCIVHYKCSEYRHKESETTLNWKDQTVKIKWPIKKPILSKKDKIGKNLEFFR